MESLDEKTDYLHDLFEDIFDDLANIYNNNVSSKFTRKFQILDYDGVIKVNGFIDTDKNSNNISQNIKGIDCYLREDFKNRYNDMYDKLVEMLLDMMTSERENIEIKKNFYVCRYRNAPGRHVYIIEIKCDKIKPRKKKEN